MNIGKKIIELKQDAVIRKSLYVLLIRVVGAGLQMLTMVLITNNAKETLVGQYNYFNSTIVLLGALTLLGMNNSFMQFSGRFEAEQQFGKVVSLYKRKLLLLSITFLSFFLLFIILSQFTDITYFKDPDVAPVLYRVFLCLFPFSLSLLNFEVIRALGLLYTSEIFRNLGRYGIFFVFTLILIFSNQTQRLLDAIIFSFGLLAIIMTLIIVFRMKKLNLGSKTSKVGLKEILNVSFPMSFSLISLLIMQSFDVYTLEQYYSIDIIAYYGVAIKISAVVGIILTSINATIAPQISKLFYSNNNLELKTVIKKATTLNITLSVPLILVIIFSANFILSIFGSNYAIAKMTLYIILLGQIVNALCGPVALYLNMTGRQFFLQKLLFVALIINVGMNLLLIPKHEMIGAAISTAFSFAFWNIFGLLYVFKKDKINLSIFGLFTK